MSIIDLTLLNDDSDEDWRDLYGFKISKAMKALEEDHYVRYKVVLEQNERKWDKFINDRQGSLELALLDKKMKTFIRHGIPGKYRGEVWLKTSGCYKRMKENSGHYTSVQETIREMKTSGEMDVDFKDCVLQIALDVPRTFPEHPFFDKEQKAKLTRILETYAFTNPEIGYCQSMNYLAGLMLMHMDEEQAYWLLKLTLEELLPLDYYNKNLFGTGLDQRVLQDLIRERFPQVIDNFERKYVDLSMIASQWFLCLYVNSMPTITVLRVWDAFFNEGHKILFRVALALFKINQEVLMDDSLNAGELFKTCQWMPMNMMDCEELLQVAFHSIFNFSKKKIERKQNIYAAIVRKEIREYRAQKMAYLKKTRQKEDEKDKNQAEKVLDLDAEMEMERERSKGSRDNTSFQYDCACISDEIEIDCPTTQSLGAFIRSRHFITICD